MRLPNSGELQPSAAGSACRLDTLRHGLDSMRCPHLRRTAVLCDTGFTADVSSLHILHSPPLGESQAHRRHLPRCPRVVLHSVLCNTGCAAYVSSPYATALPPNRKPAAVTCRCSFPLRGVDARPPLPEPCNGTPVHHTPIEAIVGAFFMPE